MKKLVILAGIAVVFTLLLIGYVYYYLPIGQMSPLFKQVQSFTRADEFAASFPGNQPMQLDILGKGGTHTLPVFAGEVTDDTRVAIHPDGERFYICNKREILEHNSSGEVLHSIKAVDFELNPDEYEFWKIIGISEDRLWVSAIHILERKSAERYAFERDVILELALNDSLATRDVHNVGDYWCAAIDPINHIAFIVLYEYKKGESTINLYDLRKKTFVEGDKVVTIPGSVGYAEFDSRGGLLLNRYEWRKDSEIVIFNPRTEEISNITKGFHAHWGAEGYIYFVRGYTQLWRCKPEEGKPEPICLLTRVPRAGLKFLSGLCVGEDHSFLAFNYSIPLLGGGCRAGLILIDLKEKEYREIPKGTFR